ncbi:MAG: hypothetical protein KDA83_03210 [Planctomycetales bacterium]|nr:hypothetical protein [Planctomycetales bacterium]
MWCIKVRQFKARLGTMLGLGSLLVASMVMPRFCRAQPSREQARFAQQLEQHILSCARPSGSANIVRFVEHPQGAGLRFYFVSVGLFPLADNPRFRNEVEGYLNWCLSLAHRDDRTWNDLSNINPIDERRSDADDSNAAMFIRLAVRYGSSRQGARWWRQNESQVISIAQEVLLENQQTESGLVTTHSSSRLRGVDQQDPGLLATTSSSYLMDNCEVYSALKMLAEKLARDNHADADEFAKAATHVASGIDSLFNADAGAFYILDTQKTAIPNFYPEDELDFYPHRAAQIFPELFDVPLGDEEETRMKYDQAWAFATANGDWAQGPITDEEFPWTVRALIAAKRGDHQTATRILAWYQADMTGKHMYIHEMAMALQALESLKTTRDHQAR